MKPFTIENKDLLLGKVVKSKNGNFYYVITCVNEEHVSIFGMLYTYKAFLDNYEFEDGSPCGIEDKYPLTFSDICQDLDCWYQSEYLVATIYWSGKKTLCYNTGSFVPITVNFINSKFRKV